MRAFVVAVLTVCTTALATDGVAAAPQASVDGPAQVLASAVRLDLAGTPTPPAPSEPTALDVLATINVENEINDGYDRSLYPTGSSQGQGCDTRDRVLIDESSTPAQVSFPGCAVVAGDWTSTYDNQVTSDPTDLDVDHVVSLAEAHGSGAWAWTPARREAFANDLDDPRTLAAVTSSVNASKGARDPSNWVPPHTPAVCGYLSDWVAVKARWDLSMDQSEHGRIRNLLTDDCPNQPIEAWSEPVVVEPTPGDCDPAYPSVCIPSPLPDLDCGDIPFRNFVVLQPDPHRFDGNNDGIGCVG